MKEKRMERKGKLLKKKLWEECEKEYERKKRYERRYV